MKEYKNPIFEEDKVVLEDAIAASGDGTLNNTIDNDGRKWSGITYFN